MTPEDFRAARIDMRMTQRQLAEAIGCSTRVIEDLEQGLRPLRPIYLIALRRLQREHTQALDVAASPQRLTINLSNLKTMGE